MRRRRTKRPDVLALLQSSTEVTVGCDREVCASSHKNFGNIEKLFSMDPGVSNDLIAWYSAIITYEQRYSVV